ncbi:site-2 protease family protein [Parashewanella spongiae]|uniref:Site-2 protease family protein n=1 Tax=Parashewanella spongiae TaxID=342950 RepID=A0A3A6UBJ0_9GAMM|nr:site-2 protease family protein [Parashewanella spongiae]MCL1076933.1 site-2 protease family protein [Parashewanella spongiae]RJY18950.1 site-2 protease family protein [Parashewanella spongiae]
MELLNIDCLGKKLRLEASLAGWQQLFWDNQLVSQHVASENNEGKFSHHFELSAASPLLAEDENKQEEAKTISIELNIDVKWQPFDLKYQLMVDGQHQLEGKRNTKDIEQQQPVTPVKEVRKPGLMGLASLGFKLLKSAKVIKVVLAGASLAAYSWLFSFQFALALIACLVVHEYGHVRAMKYFGMKTKGFYLIPFMGGMALTDEKINTRWQDVMISIMGPTFGLFMSLACLMGYWLTDNVFFAALASLSALLNLFNMLPILPLDGGHIIKSISFSMNSSVGLSICIAGAVLGVVICYMFGFTLFGFLLAIGSIEIVLEWRARHQSHLLPLDKYWQLFSAVWYALTVAGFMGIIWLTADSGDQLLSLPLKILQS